MHPHLSSPFLRASSPKAPGQGGLFAMAAASGIAVASIYYNQPMLGLILRDFPASPLARMIPTATQLGYATGLFLLLPLGDLVDRRRLIIGQFLLLALVLAAAALAGSAVVLLVACLLIGANATVAQQIIPVAADMADAHSRGRIIGTVMTGLLSGILLSQSLAGFVAVLAGWQAMFWLAVPLALAGAVMMALFLPHQPVRPAHSSYGRTLVSLLQLWRTTPALRRATLVQACLFATYAAFWSTLALHLQEPSYHLGADVAGAFGLIALTGVVAAPLAGRMADRFGAGRIVRGAAVCVLVAWGLFLFWNHLAGMILATAILSFGFQGAMVANQHIVFSGAAESRSRLNTLFMTGIFLGGSAGAACAGLIWNVGGWPVICAIAFAVTAFAILLQCRPMPAVRNR